MALQAGTSMEAKQGKIEVSLEMQEAKKHKEAQA